MDNINCSAAELRPGLYDGDAEHGEALHGAAAGRRGGRGVRRPGHRQAGHSADTVLVFNQSTGATPCQHHDTAICPYLV